MFVKIYKQNLVFGYCKMHKMMIVIIVIQIAVWAPFTFIAIIIFTLNEVQQSRHYLLSSGVSLSK